MGFANLLWSTARIKMDSALNRPVEDWGKLLGDAAAVTAMLDRLLHPRTCAQVRPAE